MAVFDVQLVPETFNLKPEKFEIKIQTITKEFADNVVSLIFLSQKFNTIASRTLGKGTLIFAGPFSTNLRNYIEENYPNIVNNFNFDSIVSNTNTIQVVSEQSEFLFKEESKGGNLNRNGSFYRYFFEITFNN